jgi:Secretion system C-terminal sorting domain
MKKIYTIILLSVFALGSFAQQKQTPSRKPSTQAVKASVNAVENPVATDVPSALPAAKEPKVKPNLPVSSSNKSMPFWEQVIGYSVYDLQSNNSIQDRIFVDENDKVHATWTMSFETTGFTERGTGYNQGEGYVWDAEPVDRIESVRTGWPGLMHGGDNSEIIINHDGTTNLNMLKRPNVGSGNWTLSEIPTAMGRNILWPRSCVDGNTIHLIAATEAPADGNTATPHNGLNGNLVYWRSDDNGTTWAIQDHIFPEIDSNEYSRIDGDGYAIHARDGHVSIGIFSEFNTTALLHSMDNGDTWMWMPISTFEIPGYEVDSLSDVDNDLIADTIFTSDGNGDVWIDSEMVTHVLFGTNFVLDDTPDDGFYSFFTTFDMAYWNTNMMADELLTAAEAEESAEDTDEDFIIDNIDQVASYRAGLCSMPSMAEDTDGTIYFTYSAGDEDYLDNQFCRHIYANKITGEGTFGTPVELTPDEDFDYLEYVFPSLTMKNNYLHIVAMRDEEPGMLVAGDLDDGETNDIIYLAIGNDFDTTIGVEENTSAEFTIYPNPSNGMVNLTGENLARQNVRVYDAQGKLMLNTQLNGTDNNTIDLTFLSNGVYNVVVGSGDHKVSQELIIRK